ncbi:hydroxylase [Longimycelium tulufanense]|uniref:Hydroxylase n=1 Tax=Longimycelium tulufanense TaxID=907463 RepID=A0A8J3FX62_9PSEU|nr:hydroxylase [Longimycelium tulufanense]
MQPVQADLGDVEALTAAYRGVQGVFVHLPITGDPDARTRWTHAIGAAARATRPARIVVSTSGGMLNDPASPFGVEKIAALRELTADLRAAGLTVTVLAPRLFLENLLLPPVLQCIATEGVLPYPLPVERSVAWSSHLDVADVATAVLTGEPAPESLNIGQVPGLTGNDLAAAFANHFGRPVTYRYIEPAEFAASIAPLLGPAAAAGTGALYESLALYPGLTFPAATGPTRPLGIAPRSLAAWLTELQVQLPG